MKDWLEISNLKNASNFVMQSANKKKLSDSAPNQDTIHGIRSKSYWGVPSDLKQDKIKIQAYVKDEQGL